MAAGGRARRLSCPGYDLAWVHTIRSRADVDRLAAELPTTERVVVIGGGYIGLEAAANLTKFGKQVTIVEALDRVLARVAGETLSRFYEAEHRAHGVTIRLNEAVERIVGDDRATGVRLASGEILPADMVVVILPADMVVVGIGLIPEVAPLIAAGARGGNGVEVDAYCMTSLEDVFAIGDCALHNNTFGNGMSLRVESVQNANDMAACVAKTIAGDRQPYNAVPWFWSNQYDIKLQTVGLSTGFDEAVLRGDPDARCFSVVYLRRGKVVALDCVNQIRDYVQGRSLVVAGALPDRAHLADSKLELKELA